MVIPLHIREDIKTHLAKHTEIAADSLLFTPARGGCHVNGRVFAKDVFKPALASIGRDDMRVHDLRHFAGTMITQEPRSGPRRPPAPLPRHGVPRSIRIV